MVLPFDQCASHHLRAALPLIMSARARARAEVGSTSAALSPEEVTYMAQQHG